MADPHLPLTVSNSTDMLSVVIGCSDSSDGQESGVLGFRLEVDHGREMSHNVDVEVGRVLQSLLPISQMRFT